MVLWCGGGGVTEGNGFVLSGMSTTVVVACDVTDCGVTDTRINALRDYILPFLGFFFCYLLLFPSCII